MLWLIWIALMLLVPMAVGVQVWFQLHHAPVDILTATGSGSTQLLGVQDPQDHGTAQPALDGPAGDPVRSRALSRRAKPHA